MMPYTAKRYQDAAGNVPYTAWITRLRKKNAQSAARVESRVSRAITGNFGDHKPAREGVWEIRIDVGPGYRVYYSIQNGEIILLLIGGDKGTQYADIDNAVKYLKDYQKRAKNDG